MGMAEETVNGAPVTDAMIQEWADEAETGYDVEKLRKRGRPTVGDGPGAVVPVRMDEALLQALTARAEQEHVSRSEAIREAVRAWTQVA
jgi:predicted transcriptional regulator